MAKKLISSLMIFAMTFLGIWIELRKASGLSVADYAGSTLTFVLPFALLGAYVWEEFFFPPTERATRRDWKTVLWRIGTGVINTVALLVATPLAGQAAVAGATVVGAMLAAIARDKRYFPVLLLATLGAAPLLIQSSNPIAASVVIATNAALQYTATGISKKISPMRVAACFSCTGLLYFLPLPTPFTGGHLVVNGWTIGGALAYLTYLVLYQVAAQLGQAALSSAFQASQMPVAFGIDFIVGRGLLPIQIVAGLIVIGSQIWAAVLKAGKAETILPPDVEAQFNPNVSDALLFYVSQADATYLFRRIKIAPALLEHMYDGERLWFARGYFQAVYFPRLPMMTEVSEWEPNSFHTASLVYRQGHSAGMRSRRRSNRLMSR
jgi:hypothetical protein